MARKNNLSQFEKELDAEVDETVRKFLQLHKAVALYAYRRIIDRSPVCTGRYRGSHTLSVGTMDETVKPASASAECDQSIRAPSLGEAQLKLVRLEPFSVIWIVNALPYAEALEFGSSKQAPEGIYDVALTDTEARFDGVQI